MISIEELIREVTGLKSSSEQLSFMFSGAAQSLQGNTQTIASIVRGSQTGQEAVFSLTIASQALLEAAASIKSLERTCDKCISELSK